MKLVCLCVSIVDICIDLDRGVIRTKLESTKRTPPPTTYLSIITTLRGGGEIYGAMTPAEFCLRRTFSIKRCPMKSHGNKLNSNPVRTPL